MLVVVSSPVSYMHCNLSVATWTAWYHAGSSVKNTYVSFVCSAEYTYPTLLILQLFVNINTLLILVALTSFSVQDWKGWSTLKFQRCSSHHLTSQVVISASFSLINKGKKNCGLKSLLLIKNNTHNIIKGNSVPIIVSVMTVATTWSWIWFLLVFFQQWHLFSLLQWLWAIWLPNS